ncbi:MAG: DNA polymerase/3'-5' exonuclease PolX [Gemmatimonadetes bacterium]|uniref:DNA polymerase beta n=1 Tax=Candidatus Kutchimonas denitrificans TaxID=3056748 RepID=A0AAE4Z837_9BACT|nr:DNA polymerase/3'-5' exonuclease PolX [Gemmatimonadota bacterium]NIR74212.1 DNA polymerase/3'-5' exonuclease PolX [Candidatus Kutchimonas denitrificans]NIR99834.1 DNA polymerase/3'-5' exonuclease PolX [Gemmatimonadota bacterium]NIT65423.1 DNA polymerase/3'-5' exonuclease PolX [Gemmatimonadota bacterium]NIU51788.1 DNA polymerase/3'-5' exonuclease PolX [Gemmatimonadota bacterium]
MENIDYARVFEEIADLLEIQDANPFRIRAYRNAARTIETLSQSLDSILADEEAELTDLPGIGKDMAAKIRELHETGSLQALENLRQEVPGGLIEVMRIPGLGPKRARQLWDELEITTLAELEVAAREDRLESISGFGPTLQARVLKGIEELRARAGRFKLSDADIYVPPLLKYLRESKGVTDLEVAGSYRRRCETVGDIDILVTAAEAASIMDAFVDYPEAREVLARGPTKSSIRLKSGLQVDLRVVERESYGAAMVYFTGSKAHNIVIRGISRERKLKINEYGVFRGGELIAGKTEAEVYAAIDLPWITPELREDRGEVRAAKGGKLPRLIERGEIRGDLQMHTQYSDGKETVEEMVEGCRARGYEYMAITDHGPALAMTGLEPDDFREQYREIDEVQSRYDDIRILKSAEVDIMADGTLDLPDDLLAEMDVIVISVHHKFNMSRGEMTRRITRAMQHPRVNILAHPTGRLINRREPYPVDVEQLVKVAADHGVMLELNSQPDRLDLRDFHLQMARDAGVKVVISTDAHRTAELDFIAYGVDQARRGWLEKEDVANTCELDAFLELLNE